MKRHAPVLHDEYTALILDGEEVEQASEDDLWFLPGPMEEEPDYLPPGPRAEPCEAEVLEDWRKAEAGHAARLARVAGRLGALAAACLAFRASCRKRVHFKKVGSVLRL